MTTNALALALPLVYGSEGCRLTAYLDTVAKPPVWTIGHGTTYVDGKPVQEGLVCSRAAADAWAEADMAALADQVERLARVPLDDYQLAALISFAYNLGIGAFGRSSVLEALREGRYQAAADRLLEYDEAGGRAIVGLETRRAHERSLFMLGTAPAATAKAATADELNQQELDRLPPQDA